MKTMASIKSAILVNLPPESSGIAPAQLPRILRLLFSVKPEASIRFFMNFMGEQPFMPGAHHLKMFGQRLTVARPSEAARRPHRMRERRIIPGDP